MQKKIAKTFYAVALPVFYKLLELLDGFYTLLAGDGVIGTSQDGRGSFDTL